MFLSCCIREEKGGKTAWPTCCGALCGAPLDLKDSSKPGIKPLPVVAEVHQGTRGACQPHLSIGCTSNTLNFGQSGHSLGKHLGMLGVMVVGKKRWQKLHTWLFWFSGSAVLGRPRQCPWRLPQSQEHRDCLCPALLPVSCQTGIACLLALAVWITWKFSLQNFSYFFGIAFKNFFLWKAALAASLWSEI